VATRSTPQSSDIEQVRLAAEADLETFIRLVSPKQVLGDIHCELCAWMTRAGRKNHQLILLPRDHQKSRMIAYKVVWWLTKNPEFRFLYISSTANLAEKQLKFIKDILTSKIYRTYWPLMVNEEEGKREKWTNTEISIDHPKRKEEGVRDPTIFTGGLTTNLVGLHCDVAVLDDTVTNDTAYTIGGRETLMTQYSLLSSIEGADAEEWTVGTRYFDKDLYGEQINMVEDLYDEEGNVTGHEPVYEVFQREVEDRGDGTGKFLWPRQQREDGKWFGFDQRILAQKRAKYLNKSHFRAQYYNDPNDITDAPIDRTLFQYYDKKWLKCVGGRWSYKEKRLNVYAAIDFAYSRAAKADYTALVVIGIDGNLNLYILDIVRIKTDKISDYYQLIINSHSYWNFRKLRAEVNAAQKNIVNELKFSYLIPNGIALPIDEKNRTRHEGTKEERIAAILEPRYDNQTIWHYQGGECEELEQELVLRRPPHDDIKDALASVIEIAVPPSNMSHVLGTTRSNIVYHPRFGGVAI